MQNKNASSTVLVLGKIIAVVCIAGIILNVFCALLKDTYWNKGILQFIAIAVWIYGLLCNRGIIKKKVSEDENGVIEYSVAVPIVQIGILRVIELLWLMFRHGEDVIWPRFVILAVADVVYIMLQLVDKMNYYYIGIREDSRGEEDYAE